MNTAIIQGTNIRTTIITMCARDLLIRSHKRLERDPYDVGAVLANIIAHGIFLELIFERITGLKKCVS